MNFTTLLKLYEDIETDELDNQAPEETDNVQDDISEQTDVLSRLIYDEPSEFKEIISDFVMNNFAGESFHAKEEFLESFADKLNSSDIIGKTIIVTTPSVSEIVLDKEFMNFFIDVLDDVIDDDDIDFGKEMDNQEISTLVDNIFTKMEEVVPFEGEEENGNKEG